MEIINSDDAKNRNIPSFGFVSVRIMQSLIDTWEFWFENHKDKKPGEIKTLKMGIDSFFTVFLDSQAKWLKEESKYNDFITETKVMTEQVLGFVTKEQKSEADRLVDRYEVYVESKRAV